MDSSSAVKIVLRAECKPNEKRAPLTPAACGVLIENGFEICVEKSTERTFEDELYVSAGCKLVESGYWKTADKDVYIVGLKELDEDVHVIEQTHIYFAHCYKGQSGWKDTMQRFKSGGGEIWDVEFMVDERGRQVVAEFSTMAGLCGCALAIDLWSHQKLTPSASYGAVQSYTDQDKLVAHVKDGLSKAAILGSGSPKIIIIGARGRCGIGAQSFAKSAGIAPEQIALWGTEETKAGGPFPELLNYDILINCMFLRATAPGASHPSPFLTRDTLKASSGKQLTVLCDVSCDIGNPANPFPFVEANTTFDKPVIQVFGENTLNAQAKLDILAIDHLPTLLPRESSERFSEKILPYILQLKCPNESFVWTTAKKYFTDKLCEL